MGRSKKRTVLSPTTPIKRPHHKRVTPLTPSRSTSQQLDSNSTANRKQITINDLPQEIITIILQAAIHSYEHPFSQQRQRNLFSLTCRPFFHLLKSSHKSSFVTLGRNPLVRLSREIWAPNSVLSMKSITSFTFDFTDPKHGERPGERQVAASLIGACGKNLKECRIWMKGRETEEEGEVVFVGVPIWSALKKCQGLETFELKFQHMRSQITLGGELTTILTSLKSLTSLSLPRILVPQKFDTDAFSFAPSLTSLSLHLTPTNGRIALFSHLLVSSLSTLTHLTLYLAPLPSFKNIEIFDEQLAHLLNPFKHSLESFEMKVSEDDFTQTWSGNDDPSDADPDPPGLDFLTSFLRDSTHDTQGRITYLSIDSRFLSQESLEIILTSKRLRTFEYLMEGGPDPIWSIDLLGRTIHEVFGKEREKDLSGRVGVGKIVLESKETRKLLWDMLRTWGYDEGVVVLTRWEGIKEEEVREKLRKERERVWRELCKTVEREEAEEEDNSSEGEECPDEEEDVDKGAREWLRLQRETAWREHCERADIEEAEEVDWNRVLRARAEQVANEVEEEAGGEQERDPRDDVDDEDEDEEDDDEEDEESPEEQYLDGNLASSVRTLFGVGIFA